MPPTKKKNIYIFLDGEYMDNNTRDAIKLFVELIIIFAVLIIIPALILG